MVLDKLISTPSLNLKRYVNSIGYPLQGSLKRCIVLSSPNQQKHKIIRLGLGLAIQRILIIAASNKN